MELKNVDQSRKVQVQEKENGVRECRLKQEGSDSGEGKMELENVD